MTTNSFTVKKTAGTDKSVTNVFSNSIIPGRQSFYGTSETLDLKAICIFAALGFFLDTDTFWVDRKTFPTASICETDADGGLISAKPFFKWHYAPRDISFDKAVTEFTELFEEILREQTADKKVILPLSGGLDSRTQAAALKNIGANVESYSYSFENGLDETVYSKKIAEAQGFPLHRWQIENGYLWNVIDSLAQINQCYSEFTHPRQMAFVGKYRELGDVFSLGHWGDVLFDDMGAAENLSFARQLNAVIKKIVKKSGIELGKALWKNWRIEGDFEDYLYERIKKLFAAIEIEDNADARIRAFKSMYWATRWTSVNLSIFESVKPITLPYFDDRMCKFICTVPEKYLAGRKIQIEYLKRRAPKLAQITWQDHRPFNLNNYDWDKSPWNLPYRIYHKAKRAVGGKQYTQRNWELQFTGAENEHQLKKRLFEEPKFTDWIAPDLIAEFYGKFSNTNAVYYSHGVSMLLTLSLFSRHFK